MLHRFAKALLNFMRAHRGNSRKSLPTSQSICNNMSSFFVDYTAGPERIWHDSSWCWLARMILELGKTVRFITPNYNLGIALEERLLNRTCSNKYIHIFDCCTSSIYMYLPHLSG